MNCLRVREALSAYYDGELTDKEQTDVSAHLNQCDECKAELARFHKISHLTQALSAPPTPGDLWPQIEKHLHNQSETHGTLSLRKERPGQVSRNAAGRLALAASLLLALGIGWVAYHALLPGSERQQLAADFGQYLEEFRRDPDAAQDILLANYESRRVTPDQAIEHVGYRPAVADGLPDEYTLVSTHVMNMPCCTCVQSHCKRADGSTLAIFEHDDEEQIQWFGRNPSVRKAQCRGKECCLVALKDSIAVTWQRGSRHITAIGVTGLDEMNRLVAWVEDRDDVL